MFIYLSLEALGPQDHLLRPIRKMENQALAERSAYCQASYTSEGLSSIHREMSVRAWWLRVLSTIRSSRPLIDQLDYNLPIRWFVGISMDERVCDQTVFSKNQEHDPS